MNRWMMALFSLVTILFLLGGMVTAEEGTNTDSAGSDKKMDAAKISGVMKKELVHDLKVKAFKAETQNEMEIRAMERVAHADPTTKVDVRLRMTGNLPANLDDEIKAALVRFNIDDATLARIRELSTDDQAKVWEEIRVRFREKGDRTEYDLRLKTHADHAKAVLAAQKLEGDARHHERLRIALALSERLSHEALKEKLAALKEKLAKKTKLSETDLAEIEDTLWEQRETDFKEKAPRVLAIAERINERLTTFISRLENKIEEASAEGKNTARLEAGLKKLNNLQDQLEAQLEETQSSWEAFSAEPSKDGLKTVHHDLVQLRVLAKHAVHDMHVIVRWYKHFHDEDGNIPSIEAEAFEEALVDEAELETIVELEAEAEADAIVGEDVETEDSGTDSPSDSMEVDEIETEDSGMDSPEDIAENITGGTV